MYFVASTVIEGANKDRFVCSFAAIFDATLHYFANNLAYKNTRYNCKHCALLLRVILGIAWKDTRLTTANARTWLWCSPSVGTSFRDARRKTSVREKAWHDDTWNDREEAFLDAPPSYILHQRRWNDTIVHVRIKIHKRPIEKWNSYKMNFVQRCFFSAIPKP